MMISVMPELFEMTVGWLRVAFHCEIVRDRFPIRREDIGFTILLLYKL